MLGAGQNTYQEANPTGKGLQSNDGKSFSQHE